MPAYKDEKKGTWYVSFHYFDWTGKNVRKLKRGFATKRKAQEWEQSFLRTKAASMDMTFSEFFTVYRLYITNITGNEKIDAEKLISQLFQGSLILKIKGTDNVITERM